MSLKHGLLGLLNYKSLTGYELDKTFRSSLSFFWQAKTSQIYRELDAMEEKGWLNSQRIMQTEKPNKRVYTITHSGKEELANWFSLPDSDIADAMRVKSAFLMRIFFAGETTTQQALALLRSYREKCMESKNALSLAHVSASSYAETITPETITAEKRVTFWKLSILYGESYYASGIAWADQAIALLEEENE